MYEVHTVTQEDVTIACNWWFDMSYGRDWVIKQLFDNLCEEALKETDKSVERDASEG